MNLEKQASRAGGIIHAAASVLLLSIVVPLCCPTCQAQGLSSWKLVSITPATVNSMAYGNGTFLGLGGGFWYRSNDGSNWTIYSTPPIVNQGGVAYGNGSFMAFGTNIEHNANYILESTNGVNWSTIYTSSNTLSAAAFGNNTWVFVGNNNDIVAASLTTSNLNWSEFRPNFSPLCITYGNGLFVMGANSGGYFTFFSSIDGKTWRYITNTTIIFPNSPVTASAFGNGVYVICAMQYISASSFSSKYFASSNLVDWTSSSLGLAGGNYSYLPVSFGGNQFVTGFFGVVYTSSDGNTWFSQTDLGSVMSGFTYGQGRFVATSGNYVYQSAVFATNFAPAPTTLGISTYPGVTINGTAGSVYQIQYSTNLSTWQMLTNFTLPYSPYLWIDTSSTVTGQRVYRSVQLQ